MRLPDGRPPHVGYGRNYHRDETSLLNAVGAKLRAKKFRKEGFEFDTYDMYQIQILPSETFWPVVWPPPRSKGMFPPDGNFVRNPHEGDDHREDALKFIC